ncbi:MAG: DNA replication licensing factor MCM9-like protein [Monoraphidium minutum]|nr:MAG: DNA replication licensing factor MCM9-like protein [Monoraphidium minutum]
MGQEEPLQEESAVSALLACCGATLEQVLLAPGGDEHFCVPLDAMLLAQADPLIADALVRAPKATLALLEGAVYAAQEALLECHPQQDAMSVKPQAHVRLHGLPYSLDPKPHALNPTIGRIGSSHIGRLVTVYGTVVKTGPVKMFEHQRLMCCNKCKHRFYLTADPDDASRMQLPAECPSPPGPRGACPGTNFLEVQDADGGAGVHRQFTNIQEVRVQERLQCLDAGSVPSAISVVLLDEMADTCQAGDDVEVTGVVVARWRPLYPGARCDAELAMRASHMAVEERAPRPGALLGSNMEDLFRDFWLQHRDKPLQGRNKIIASICPQIFGLYIVKLAVALMVVGGVARRDEAGTHIRGELHMLLVGDPGTGKSQVMKFAARIAARSVMTTGRGTTVAGLTVAAVKEGGQWALEAGALVLADGGLCCIDEFDGIKEADRATIHEAMEQQTVHIAKAGMVTCLPTRASVLGVTNPRGAFGPAPAHAAAATNLSAPLLSRFDVVLMLADVHEPAWDAIVSGHVLANHQQAASQGSQEAPVQGWPVDVLRAYLAWAKAQGGAQQELTMAPEAEAVLIAYYQAQRRSEDRSAARTTIRLLESLVRLAQAHARLLARGEVGLQDAVVAVAVADASMSAAALLGPINALHTHFPTDPDGEYAGLEREVLAALELWHMIDPGLPEGGGGGGGGGGAECRAGG